MPPIARTPTKSSRTTQRACHGTMGPACAGPARRTLALLVVRCFAVRVDPVRAGADLGRHFACFLRLLRVLLRDALPLLGLSGAGVRLLAQALRLLAPLFELPLPIPHRRDSDCRQNEHDADRNHDPNPSCHYILASSSSVTDKRRLLRIGSGAPDSLTLG